MQSDYEILAETVREPLFAFAFKLSQDKNLAEDLVQEALLIAHRKFAKFDRKRGSFKSWTNSILLNKWRDHLRSAKRREINVTSLLPVGGELDDIADPAAMRNLIVDAEEEAVASVTLADMLDKLNTTERRIAKGLSEGESDDEIRRALGFTMERYERTLASIRSKLAEYAPQRHVFHCEFAGREFSLRA